MAFCSLAGNPLQFTTVTPSAFCSLTYRSLNISWPRLSLLFSAAWFFSRSVFSLFSISALSRCSFSILNVTSPEGVWAGVPVIRQNLLCWKLSLPQFSLSFLFLRKRIQSTFLSHCTISMRIQMKDHLYPVVF